MKAMKPIKFFSLLVAAALSSCLLSCSDRPDRMFRDFFVSVADENGSQTSRILSSSNNTVVTYYFQLVSEERTEPLTVDFEVRIGDGLSLGTDFTFQNDIRSITFEPGVYKKPFRINYLRHEIDPAKDNTITIEIVSASDPSIILGYPGPGGKYRKHIVTKY